MTSQGDNFQNMPCIQTHQKVKQAEMKQAEHWLVQCEVRKQVKVERNTVTKKKSANQTRVLGSKKGWRHGEKL